MLFCGTVSPVVPPFVFLSEGNMNLEEMIEKEHRIIQILYEAKTIQTLPWHMKMAYWYKVLKPILLKCVGFGAENPELNTTESYDIIYQLCLKLADM